MKRSLVLKKFRRITLVILPFFIIIAFIAITYNYVFSDQGLEDIEDIRNQINEAFKKAGIFDGYVQYNEKIKMFEVMGKFRTYEEFLYAYMIAQVYAGVKKVSPVYSIKHAVIIHTPIEKCLPYVILGKPCPYVSKKDSDLQLDFKDIQDEQKGKRKIAVVIGISIFKNNGINPIVGADNDALLWGHYLEKMGYKVFYLINENATRKRVIDTIDTVVENLRDGDIFVLVASSHGAPKNERGEVGIVLYDSGEVSKHKCMAYVPAEPHLQAANKMCALVKDSLSIDRDVLSKLTARKVTFIPIIDACYSGDALRGYVGDVLKAEEVSPLDFYEARLRANAPKALGLFVSSANGFRLAYSTRDVRQISNVTDKMIAVTERGLGRLVIAEKVDMDRQTNRIIFKPYSHGIFSFIVVNSLEENGNKIGKTVEMTRDIINRESKRVCELEGSGKAIRRVGECPEDGQQPVVLRINLDDFSFN